MNFLCWSKLFLSSRAPRPLSSSFRSAVLSPLTAWCSWGAKQIGWWSALRPWWSSLWRSDSDSLTVLFVQVSLDMFLVNSLCLSRLPLKVELSSTTLTFTMRRMTTAASVRIMKIGAVGLWAASPRGGVAAAVALIGCPPAEAVAATTCKTGETMMTWAHAGAPLLPREGEEEGVVLHETCPWDPHTTGEGETYTYVIYFWF